MSKETPITVARGDGIGPEIMEASLRMIQAAAAAGSSTIAAGSQKVTAAGYDIVKTETLRTSDGQQGFTLAQVQ